MRDNETPMEYRMRLQRLAKKFDWAHIQKTVDQIIGRWWTGLTDECLDALDAIAEDLGRNYSNYLAIPLLEDFYQTRHGFVEVPEIMFVARFDRHKEYPPAACPYVVGSRRTDRWYPKDVWEWRPRWGFPAKADTREEVESKAKRINRNFEPNSNDGDSKSEPDLALNYTSNLNEDLATEEVYETETEAESEESEHDSGFLSNPEFESDPDDNEADAEEAHVDEMVNAPNYGHYVEEEDPEEDPEEVLEEEQGPGVQENGDVDIDGDVDVMDEEEEEPLMSEVINGGHQIEDGDDTDDENGIHFDWGTDSNSVITSRSSSPELGSSVELWEVEEEEEEALVSDDD